MSELLAVFDSPFWVSLVHALVHSLWVGAAVALGLAVLLRSVPARRHDLRYAAALGALASLAVSVFVAWAVVDLEREPAQHRAATTARETVRNDKSKSARNMANPTRTHSEKAEGESGSAETTANHAPVASTRPVPTAMATTNRFSHAPERSPRVRLEEAAPWIAAFWIIGVALMLLRDLRMLAGAGRIRREGRDVADTDLLAVLESARCAVGVARRVGLLISDTLASPVVMGVVRPTILLPASLVSQVPAQDLAAILAHELAHVQRHDFLVNLAQMLVEAALFFNPAAWWIGRMVRVEREACCDALASRAMADPGAYARALAAAAEWRMTAIPAFGDSDRTGLVDRVRRVLAPSTRPSLRLKWTGVVILVLAGVAAFLALHRGADLAVTATARILTGRERVAKIQEKIEEVEKKDRTKTYMRQGFDPDKAEKATIRGTVRTEDGGGDLSSLVILAHSQVPHRGLLTQFRAQGGRFDGRIRPGEVHLIAKGVDGYAPAFSGPHELDPGANLEGLDIVLRKGRNAAIRVLGRDGEPIEGVQAEATYGHPAGGTYIKVPNSDPEGLIALDHISSLPLSITLEATGYQSATRKIAFEPGQTVDWTFETATPTTGQVVSGKTGEPVAGARILKCYRDDPPHHGRHFGDLERAPQIATTDADGRFTLDSLRSGSRYLLAVDAEGFAPKVLLGICAGEKDLVVEMPPETVVMGTLTGPLDSLQRYRDGTPYVGYSFPLRTGTSSFWQSGKSSVEIRDGKGHFIITHVSPGELDIRPGHATRRIEVEGVVPDLTIDMRVPEVGLGPTGEITTRTVVFRLNTPDGEIPTTGVLSVTHKEMQRGHRYNITTPAPIQNGQVRLVVSTPNRVGYRPEGMVGYWVPEKYAAFEVPPGSSPHVAGLTVYPAGAIVGTVAEADGSPARGSMISVRVVRKPPIPDRRSVDVRVKDGSSSNDRTSRFTAQPLPLGGSYQIYMRRGATFAVSDPVELTETRPVREVALRYGETSSFLVRVMDADGNPLQGIKLSPSLMIADYSCGFGDKTTGADGTAHFEGFSLGLSGQYKIATFGNMGYQSQRIEIDPKDDEVAIRLKKGAVIEGVVLGGKTGRPVPNARVSAWPRRYQEGLTSSEDMTTARDGRFRLTTLQPGLEHTLRAYATSGSTGAAAVATAGSGETVTIRVPEK